MYEYIRKLPSGFRLPEQPASCMVFASYQYRIHGQAEKLPSGFRLPEQPVSSLVFASYQYRIQGQTGKLLRQRTATTFK